MYSASSMHTHTFTCMLTFFKNSNPTPTYTHMHDIFTNMYNIIQECYCRITTVFSANIEAVCLVKRVMDSYTSPFMTNEAHSDSMWDRKNILKKKSLWDVQIFTYSGILEVMPLMYHMTNKKYAFWFVFIFVWDMESV